MTIDARPGKDEVQQAIRAGSGCRRTAGPAGGRLTPDAGRHRARLVQGQHRRGRGRGRAGRGLARRPARRRGDRAAARRRRRGHPGRCWPLRTRRARWHQAPGQRPGRGARCTAAGWNCDGNGRRRTRRGQRAAAAGRPRPAAARRLPASGELIGHALDAGARRIVVALGGSASTDGGTGALAALGARFLDAAGQDAAAAAAVRWPALAAVDLAGLRPPPAGGVTCLTDVRAPLLGPRGAAAVFGPQKGAAAAAGRASWRRAWPGWRPCSAATRRTRAPEPPGAPATASPPPGVPASRPGAAELGRIAGLAGAGRRRAWCITGEGRYDATSATGKITGSVLAAAARAGVPAAIVAGVRRAPTAAGRGRGRRWPRWPAARRGDGRSRPVAAAPRAGAGRGPLRPAGATTGLRSAGRRFGRRRSRLYPGPVREIAVFSGSAHPELAAEICAHLGVTLLPGPAAPVRQRLPRGPAAVQLPGAGRIPHPAALRAGPGAPGRAAAHARRRARGPRRPGSPR